MARIREYEQFVGKTVIDELELLANKLKGRTVLNVNSTKVGGGVAEILARMVPLLNEIGVDARWEVIKGDEKFFQITKKIHNALHHRLVEITKKEWEYFEEINRLNAQTLDLSSDILFIHDPQPIGLIEIEKKLQKEKKWIWRCHVDFSAPDERVWDYLKNYIEKYDVAVFSAPQFSRQLSIRQIMISPSIDPLSDKNKELPPQVIDEVLERFNIDKQRPIVTQVSRFDYLKDPIGVIDVFNMVKKYVDCQLVLAGGGATDDPEGDRILQITREKAGNDPDIHILHLPPDSHIEINALQRASTVILQKSLREGFGLTVAEALWKGKPVIASAVGGIPLQIAHKYSGILTHTLEGTAFWLRQLLYNPDYARKLGENGREHIKNNYLLTRHLREYLLLFLSLQHLDKDIINL